MKSRHTIALRVFACVSLLGTCTLYAQDARTLTDVEKQIQQTSEMLQALDRDIAESQKMKIALAKAVEDAQSKVEERDHRLQSLDQEIEQYNNMLDKLDLRVGQAWNEVELRKQALASILRNSQRIGQQTPLKTVLQNNDLALADRLAVYTEYVLAFQQDAIEQQVRELEQIENARATTLKDRNWLNYIQKKAQQQRKDFARNASSTQQKLGEVEAGLDQKSSTVAELRADQQRLQSLMDELKTAQSAQSGYFAAGKGRYPAPVSGSISARFGDVKSVGKLRWNGLFIDARRGRPVKTIADGEIIYSNWLQGFGHLVIIDHGDNYTSLYAGNRDTTVNKGDWVESGATIATVGDSGGQNGNGVYFEIRHNAKAEDPETWLSPDSDLLRASK